MRTLKGHCFRTSKTVQVASTRYRMVADFQEAHELWELLVNDAEGSYFENF